MAQTLHLRENFGRKDNRETLSLKDWVLGLLAGLLPESQLKESTQAEFVYLKKYISMEKMAFQDILPENTDDLKMHLSVEEANLASLVGGENRSPVDMMILILCYLVETDYMTGRCLFYLQQPMGGSWPTLSLLCAMIHDSGLCQGESAGTVMSGIINSEPARLGILQVQNDGSPLPERPVRIHTPVVLNVSCGRFSWPGVTVDAECYDCNLPLSIAQKAELQAKSLNEAERNILVIRSSSILERKLTARYIARCLDRRSIFIEDQEKAFPALGPMCGLKNLLPVLSYECVPGELVKLPGIMGYKGPVLVFAGHEGTFESEQGRVTSWTVPIPTHEERKRLWNEYIDNPELADQLASDHIHGMDRIMELASIARRQRIIRGKIDVGIDEIHDAAWLRERRGFSSLAQPVKARIADNALVVRPQTRNQLELLEQRCRLREQLAEHLGVTLQARYQVGVKALFTGPSGTGKTLASGWLANRLGMPLYRVDLASVTSKYIGETEKNLAQLLSQAEQEDVVLLFDEADSLFGKRTDVKDANDRFANAQTNYLLQRIETFTGVVLLTSNSKARFDPAFTRRLDMVIDFPLPTPEERRIIWLNHLGSFHTLTKGNINQLAVQCDLSGGHIRNVVLTAAVIAKSKKTDISFEIIIQALSDEYRKLGRQILPELRKMVHQQTN